MLTQSPPPDRIKTRLQVQVTSKDGSRHPDAGPDDDHYEGTLHAIKTIVEREGLEGLYAGMFATLLGVASTNFAYFYWYSVVRTLYVKSQKVPGPASTAVELSLGAVAGALAQAFTIPISVITTRQQTQNKKDRKGFFDTAREIIDSEDGVSGLWRGMKASLVLVVNPSITYGAYQRLKDTFFPGRTSLKTWEAFFLGAASKALATIATQPLIVAKVRLQSKPPPDRAGKPFKSFGEVLAYTVKHEGALKLYKGIGPQITKGILVQGILMMTKERVELLFILLFAYVRRLRAQQVANVASKLNKV